MIYLAEKQPRWEGHFPTFNVYDDETGENFGLYTRTEHATNLIAKQHPVGVSIERPYQIDVDKVIFHNLTN